MVRTRSAAFALFLLVRPPTEALPRDELAHHSTARRELVATAPMRIARMAHTATALPDGRVLIAGGFTDDARASVSAEAYDPRRGTFDALPRMGVVRHSHTATALRDGRVLIVGGYGRENAVLAQAEIFDPTTNRFEAVAPMRQARAGHVAVRLSDGRVLIAGGVGPNWTFLDGAEVFDPTTGRFSPTRSMTVARESHVAVLLDDGRVLVVGGHRGRRSAVELFASAELYDPRTERFTATGSMRVRRHKHDAARLPDGRVLVLGGSDERDDRGAYRSTEVYDPAAGRFRDGPDLQLARYKHAFNTLTLPDGSLLVSGGAPQAERYDPVANRFDLVPGAPQMGGQFSASALLPGGAALVTGGYGNGAGPRVDAWVYRP
ncbi:MAG: kelch repeat-containing protein [Gemmatimonadaceae bacterium]|nr:kelch repeat-containing protein [Gemmatimonadaceae bacterium]